MDHHFRYGFLGAWHPRYADKERINVRESAFLLKHVFFPRWRWVDKKIPSQSNAVRSLGYQAPSSETFTQATPAVVSQAYHVMCPQDKFAVFHSRMAKVIKIYVYRTSQTVRENEKISSESDSPSSRDREPCTGNECTGGISDVMLRQYTRHPRNSDVRNFLHSNGSEVCSIDTENTSIYRRFLTLYIVYRMIWYNLDSFLDRAFCKIQFLPVTSARSPPPPQNELIMRCHLQADVANLDVKERWDITQVAQSRCEITVIFFFCEN